MGEAPAVCSEDLKSTPIRDKRYLVGGKDDDSTSSVEVQIFTESTGEWVTPVVLGTKPKTCESHHAVPASEDRILIIGKGCKPDDCLWFLEVDTQYVREQKKIYDTEVVAWSKGVIGNAEKLVVISGPSGVGKGTLISKLMAEYPSLFGFSVSHTTRAPRKDEKDGRDYHFTEKSVMEEDIKDGKFLEFASVHENLYGTSIETVEVVADEGKRCILDIDVQGARSVRASTFEAIFIFICPPSMEELEKRLRARGTETDKQILKRLENAKAELEQGMSSGLKHILYNDNIAECYQKLKEQGKSSGLFDHILYNDNLEECYKKLKKLLGLDGNVGLNPQPPCRGLDLPSEFSVSKADNRIIISFENAGSEKSYNDQGRIVLDVSSLKGGAPGRTRGLEPILH